MKLTRLALASAALLGVLGSAQATTTDIGAAAVGAPLSFAGLAAPGPFLDIFTFTLPVNSGSGYSVSNFTLLPGLYNTVFATLNLVSNADGVIGSIDDSLLATVAAPASGSSTLALAWGAAPAGKYYLSVSGVTNGTAGGIYTGAISVTAVPEPETYAMMLAGLMAVGFVATRRRQG